MGFRTIVVKNRAKLETRLGYLIIRGDEEKWCNISEIDALIVESTGCAVTCQALLELLNANVNVVFCNEKHMPYAGLTPFSANYGSSGNIKTQSRWDADKKSALWRKIVSQKIFWQMRVLEKYNEAESADMLKKYIGEITENDATNREGHAAKVYFNSLFGVNFSRRNGGRINSALNYAYAVLMSEIARCVTASGYINALGIRHENQFNEYNLACDLMEVFRPLTDDFVITYCKDDDFKSEASKLLSMKITIKKREFYLDSACEIFVRSALRFMKGETDELVMVEGYAI
ncbi:MAG: type II CRISPR-associated endonuclease Cas1 [Clostridiales bacterium]|jgi:CRISPR-associated endonuclease Cas1 subtype II|nr:type II CRISPR-associated endonuclease Cas1 [Clostridiales bacterium]